MTYGIYDGTKVISRFVAPMTVRSNSPVFLSDTIALHRLVKRRKGQRWEIETRLEPMVGGEEDMFVHMLSRHHHKTLQVIMPQNYGAVMARQGSPTITAVTGTIGQSQVAIQPFSGFIPKGTFLQFAGHSKVYMLVQDVTGIAFDQVINIFPPLLAAPTGVQMKHLDDVILTCYYDLDTTIGMSYSDGITFDVGTIRLVEAV